MNKIFFIVGDENDVSDITDDVADVHDALYAVTYTRFERNNFRGGEINLSVYMLDSATAQEMDLAVTAADKADNEKEKRRILNKASMDLTPMMEKDEIISRSFMMTGITKKSHTPDKITFGLMNGLKDEVSFGVAPKK